MKTVLKTAPACQNFNLYLAVIGFYNTKKMTFESLKRVIFPRTDV